MSDRSTKDILLSNGETIVVYDYITGREQRAIQAIFIDGAHVDSGGGVAGVEAIRSHAAQNKTFELFVKEVRPVDGEPITQSRAIIDHILDLPSFVFDEVVKFINDATNGAKKTTPTS